VNQISRRVVSTRAGETGTEELSRCEQIIDQGLRTFFEVGAALLAIRMKSCLG
jgi:hypothetical protein